jgi:hypothetical protein
MNSGYGYWLNERLPGYLKSDKNSVINDRLFRLRRESWKDDMHDT